MNYEVDTRNSLFELMEEGSVFLIQSGLLKHKTADQFYPFIVNKHFFYLTGINEENIILMMVKSKGHNITYLFIEETTPFMKQWVGEKISKKEASEISSIPTNKIFYLKSFSSLFRRIMTPSRTNLQTPTKLYLDLLRPNEKINAVSLEQFSDIIDTFKELKIENINQYINKLRMYKNDAEIKKLKSAIDITKKGLDRIMKSLAIRDNEHQIEADFVHEITLNGADGIGFDTILASGMNATILHYEDNNKPLNKGELLLCDLGAIKDQYSADISRTYPISGLYTSRQKDIYNLVLKCNKECIEYVKPGITLNDIHNLSKKILSEGAVSLGLIKEENEITKYYYHSIGHFLGLNVHDVSVGGLKLEAGMIITIEPGLYIKEENIGIRIEDNILVTDDGYINLSAAIIKEIKDIESFINENKV